MQRVTQRFRNWICFCPQVKCWEGICWVGPIRCRCSYSDEQPGLVGLTGPLCYLRTQTDSVSNTLCLHFVFLDRQTVDRVLNTWVGNLQIRVTQRAVNWHPCIRVRWDGEVKPLVAARAACLSCAVHLPIRTDPLGTGEIQLAQDTFAVAEWGMFLNNYCALKSIAVSK
jgi:hypothetical protein